MGRTVPTYRMALESLMERWSQYRRGLRKDDREAFDRMVSHARNRTPAGSAAAHLDPFESAVLSMILEHERELERLRRDRD